MQKLDFTKLSDNEILTISQEDLESLSTEDLEVLSTRMQFAADDAHVTEKSLKTMINSLYGALANKFFFIKNPDFAAAITSSGRFFIQLCAERAEEYFQEMQPLENDRYVVYGDTDSFYYKCSPFVQKQFGKVQGFSENEITEVTNWCNEFEQEHTQKVLERTIKEYAELLNIARPDVVGAEREVIADAGVFIAKKKYFARVRDLEGVRFSSSDPYIKVMGLEIAKSSSPDWVKKKLKESISHIMDKSEAEFLQWVETVRKEFATLPASDLCSYQGVNNLDYKLTDKGIPQGSRSAIMHNLWVQEQGLESEIPLLEAGEKYKRCYLKTPNRFKTEILSFDSDKIAELIEQDGIFDYAKNFKLLFEQPLQRMVESLNYDVSGKPRFVGLDLSGDW